MTAAPLPIGSDAQLLFSCLHNFERGGLLAMDPAEVLSTMTAEMLDAVHVLAPAVARWLEGGGMMAPPVEPRQAGQHAEATSTP